MSIEQQHLRYSRQTILKEIGEAGQKKLLGGRLLIIGAGGLGSPAAYYCAAAGIGRIGIVDSDTVDISNLQRQILHTSLDVHKHKTDSAKEKLLALNPDIQVDIYQERVDTKNIFDIITGYDFIIDATDSFPSKFLINDACVIKKKAFSHAGVLGFAGQVFTYAPGSACLRCVFPSPPQAEIAGCKEAGIVGAAAGVIGSFQAVEAIKYLLGIDGILTNRLLTVDALTMKIRIHHFKKRADCSSCSGKRKKLDSKEYEEWDCSEYGR